MCPLNRSELTRCTNCYVKIETPSISEEGTVHNQQGKRHADFELIPAVWCSKTVGNVSLKEVAIDNKVLRVELHRLQNIGQFKILHAFACCRYLCTYSVPIIISEWHSAVSFLINNVLNVICR